MKKLYTAFALCLLISVIASCSKKDEIGNVSFVTDFPISIQLAGNEVDFDSVSGIPGAVNMNGENFLFFQYESDNLIMETDSAFVPQRYIFPKGQGPNEMLAASSVFGEIMGHDAIGAYDPYSCKIVTIQKDGSDYSTYQFEEQLRKAYAPRSTHQLKTGEFASLRGLNQFGMVSHDSCGLNIKEWEIGIDATDDILLNNIILSGRSMSYNENRGIVAETYGALPYIILHNEDGTIQRIICVGPEIDYGEIDTTNPQKQINSVRMTDNYIYALGYENDKEAPSVIYVIDYDGNGVARLMADDTYSFCIDTKRRRIITVNPNIEIPVKVYSIPDKIKNP